MAFLWSELGSTRLSPLDQINGDNIKDLKSPGRGNRTVFSRIPRSEAETTADHGQRPYFTMDQRRYVIAAMRDRRTFWIYRPNEGDTIYVCARKVHRGVL